MNNGKQSKDADHLCSHRVSARKFAKPLCQGAGLQFLRNLPDRRDSRNVKKPYVQRMLLTQENQSNNPLGGALRSIEGGHNQESKRIWNMFFSIMYARIQRASDEN